MCYFKYFRLQSLINIKLINFIKSLITRKLLGIQHSVEIHNLKYQVINFEYNSLLDINHRILIKFLKIFRTVYKIHLLNNIHVNITYILMLIKSMNLLVKHNLMDIKYIFLMINDKKTSIEYK